MPFFTATRRPCSGLCAMFCSAQAKRVWICPSVHIDLSIYLSLIRHCLSKENKCIFPTSWNFIYLHYAHTVVVKFWLISQETCFVFFSPQPGLKMKYLSKWAVSDQNLLTDIFTYSIFLLNGLLLRLFVCKYSWWGKLCEISSFSQTNLCSSEIHIHRLTLIFKIMDLQMCIQTS